VLKRVDNACDGRIGQIRREWHAKVEAGGAVNHDRRTCCVMKGPPDGLRNRPPESGHRHGYANAIENGMVHELLRLEHPAVAHDVGEIGTISAMFRGRRPCDEAPRKLCSRALDREQQLKEDLRLYDA
jgi:hypothetical protein